MSAHDHKPFNASQQDWQAAYGLARTVLTVAQNQDDGRLTYSDLWEFYRGETPPRGQWWLRVLSPRLNQLAHACVDLHLPYLNALIVRKDLRREPSLAAVKNMWEFAQQNGVAVGDDPRQFVLEQGRKAAALSLHDLDKAFGQITI